MSAETAQGDWRSRLTSAAEAVAAVRPGDRVFVGSACATPRSLVDALEQLAQPPPPGRDPHPRRTSRPFRAGRRRRRRHRGRRRELDDGNTRRLYDLVDDDPRFAFHPIDRVCEPAVVAARERMVSVTQAFAIDLSGQVCTESLDGRLYGGVSTGPSFHRGALASPKGIAIVCLASQTPAGRSAIRLDLEPGEAVAIPRGDVHWVITEYGTAYLFGRSLAERAVALIEIAHPDERDELLRAATDSGLVPAGQTLRSRTAYPEAEERDAVLRDGREVGIRPTRASDTRAMQELFYRLPPEDVRTRFFQNLQSLTDAAAQHLCSVNYEDEMAFVAVVGPRDREQLVGTVSYYVDPRAGLADVGYMVDPEWQGAGLGRILHARAVEYARTHGVRGFTADVMFGNSRMLRGFRGGDHELRETTESGITEVTMIFPS